MDFVLGMLLGAVVGGGLVGGALVAYAGGVGRLGRGLQLARGPGQSSAAATVAVPAAPPKRSGAPLRLIALLQAESRLIDFLLEDIQAFPDAQIGQAVREIHRKARAAIQQHLVLDPVLAGNESDSVTVPAGFDPSAVRVGGNVTGNPPFTGQLQHPGWRVREIKLAAPPEGADEFVIQPAEVFIP